MCRTALLNPALLLVYLEVDALQQLLHRCGFGGPSLSPSPHRSFRLLLLFAQHVHIDELKSAHFVVQQAHPCSHGRLTDDVNHITALNNYNEVKKKKNSEGGIKF